MIVETKTDGLADVAIRYSSAKARRQGEAASWSKARQTAAEGRQDLSRRPISPPPVWLRVFPGI